MYLKILFFASIADGLFALKLQTKRPRHTNSCAAAVSSIYTATSTELPDALFLTTILRSIASRSSPTWEMIPTRRFPPASWRSTATACASDSSSSEPKPSSTNIASSWMPPALLCTTSDRPSASASDALKASPPESEPTDGSFRCSGRAHRVPVRSDCGDCPLHDGAAAQSVLRSSTANGGSRP